MGAEGDSAGLEIGKENRGSTRKIKRRWVHRLHRLHGLRAKREEEKKGRIICVNLRNLWIERFLFFSPCSPCPPWLESSFPYTSFV